MVLPQEIPIIKNILNFFNKEYKTKIDYSSDKNIIEMLGLENNNSVEKALFYAVFSLFQKNEFRFDKAVEIVNITKKIEDLAINSIKKSIIHKVNNDYLLIISTKFFEGFNDKGEIHKVSKRNDFAILDYKLKKFYCQSNYIKKNFMDSLLENNIAPKNNFPIEITSPQFSKIFNIKDLFIYDIEFHKLKDLDIIDFYIRTGSKKNPINKKIKEIISRIIRDFGAYNLKSMLVAITKNPHERIRLNMIEEGMGIYKLTISPKGLKLETRKKLIDLFEKNKIKLDHLLRFKDEPIEFTIYSLIKKKKIKGYDLLYKNKIKIWDKGKILYFEKGKLKINQENLIKQIKKLTYKDFDLFENQKIELSGKPINGLILKRKRDDKRLFFIFRKSEKNIKEIEKITLNGTIPFFFIETRINNLDSKLGFLFTSLNIHNEESFTFLINRILDSPQLYKNIEKNYNWSCKKINNLNRFLARKDSQKKGADWELICNSILNYIFKESLPLGKTFLPDGITFFTKDDTILWDAKALNGEKSYLNQSVKSKGRNNIKDTIYIEVFKEKGFSFDYYAFLTCGVEKKDFEKVHKKIDSYLKKRNIKVKIVCITDNWIRGLIEYISKNEDLIRIQNNKEDFIKSLKLEFEKGYLFDFNKEIFDLIGQSNFNQDIVELRKRVKEKMNQNFI